ncbi:MAG: phage capsid protein [Paracoccaceae bacterium]
MSYAQMVEAHHKLAYSNNIKMVAQQLQNPLRSAVTMVPATGEAQDAADLLGKKNYLEGEDYSRRNPDNPTPRSRRWLIRPTVIEDGEYIDKETKFDASQDPTSPLVKNSVKTVERGVFDRILGIRKTSSGYVASGSGIMGRAIDGKRPGGSGTPLPSGNYIAADLGDPGTAYGLGLTKIRAACEGMELEDFGLETDDEIFGLITPYQKTDLINLAVETGKNLNPFDVKNIQDGKPGKLLGVNWLFSNRVPKDADGNRLIPIWSKENIVAGVWQDVEGNMWNDTSAKNLPYIHTDAYIDCVRVEDLGVRIIRCAE